MAAQKLTRGRLAQIIILMVVLIAAFVWRTITYNQTQQGEETSLTCQLSTTGCLVKSSNEKLPVSFVSEALKADAPIIIQIDNTNVKPVGIVEGVSMYMGSVPVVFTKNDRGWQGEFTVPACMHDKMEWVIKITQEDKIMNAHFTVEK
ncbi:hypothetical protein [Photobacterium kagoshimensis]|uniref:hypothetical protein n=1 Tax=Photobacterium kagoshimensis TaxID=2910242 RepID=UPI003D11AA01